MNNTVLFQPQFTPSSLPPNMPYFFKRAYNSYNLLQKNDSHCKEVFASPSRGSP